MVKVKILNVEKEIALEKPVDYEVKIIKGENTPEVKRDN